MTPGHPLRALKDDELLTALSTIVRRTNEITAEFLQHLAELDQRQLHLDLGFPSLFAYCVEALGLCEATAGRRIAVARVCLKYPEALTRIATGALHVSALCLLKQYLTTENAADLFELCSGKSARRVETLLAARFPKPDLRDSIRRLPARSTPTLNVESAPRESCFPSRELDNSSPDRAEIASAQLEAPAAISDARAELSARLAPESSSVARPNQRDAPAPLAMQRLKPLSADRFAVRFTADTEFRDLLERVRGLAGHRLPSGDMLTLLKRGLQTYERELAKERFSVGRTPRRPRGEAAAERATSNIDSPHRDQSASSLGPGAARSKTRTRVAATAVREVYARDDGQCTFISKDGRRCAVRKCLELDHVIPWAIGGEHTPINLRLRCRAHNQRYVQQCFGTAHVHAAVKHAQRHAGRSKQ